MALLRCLYMWQWWRKPSHNSSIPDWERKTADKSWRNTKCPELTCNWKCCWCCVCNI